MLLVCVCVAALANTLKFVCSRVCMLASVNSAGARKQAALQETTSVEFGATYDQGTGTLLRYMFMYMPL